MAEGFARRYGSDVMNAESAGLAPASIIQPMTYRVMAEKNISLDGQYPKPLNDLDLGEFDLLVNMSQTTLPAKGSLQVEVWDVDDPFGESLQVYQRVRDDIEMRVMRLILQLRGEAAPSRGSRKPLGQPI
jgi:protein-tyrosine-phosphatase